MDTNVILECWRVGSWRALAGGYRVETVEDCVTETQTGYQRRREEQQIDAAELRRALAAVHKVGPAELAMAVTRGPNLYMLDIGERSLWAHALSRSDAWVLCGPDAASLRFGVELGLGERLMALEALLNDVGFAPKSALRSNYTMKWHKATMAKFPIAKGRPQP